MRYNINGAEIEVASGESIAAAAVRAGIPTRHSVSGQARGPLCGMGICLECRATVNGVAHQRTCQMPATAAKPSLTGSDAVIVGAGPAGLAAARATAAHGMRVTLVDDNPAAGGQIWRGAGKPVPTGVEWVASTSIATAAELGEVSASRPLLLATGARERFLPFPGWTLPHVFGAGGLQALAKGGLPIAGKRVVIAGAGPLLLAVAGYLRTHGAIVAAICDQATAAAQARFLAALPPSKWKQAFDLGRSLRGVPVRLSTWPVAAEPGLVRLNRGRPIACDYLAVGFHLVPNSELAQLLGCATQNTFVVVDERQQTSVPHVYAAGEVTAIGGLELAAAEGEIAGLAMAGQNVPTALLQQRERARKFAQRLAGLTALRPELRRLPHADTIVCRCEDVSYARIAGYANWREAKLQTRCGMGACQGRVCGGAAEVLFGFGPDGVRPPIFPASVVELMTR